MAFKKVGPCLAELLEKLGALMAVYAEEHEDEATGLSITLSVDNAQKVMTHDGTFHDGPFIRCEAYNAYGDEDEEPEDNVLLN